MKITNVLSEIERQHKEGKNPILIGPLEFAEYEKHMGFPAPDPSGPNKMVYKIAFKEVFVRRNPNLMMFPELAVEPTK